MAVQGVMIDESEICKALEKNNGKVLYAAKDLNCHPSAIYRHLQASTKLKTVLEEARKCYDEIRLDYCENVLDGFIQTQRRDNKGKLNEDYDASHSYKSAIYYLNNKGEERGYAHPESRQKNSQIAFDAADMRLKLLDNDRIKAITGKAEPKTIEIE